MFVSFFKTFIVNILCCYYYYFFCSFSLFYVLQPIIVIKFIVMKTPLFLLRIERIPAEECELEETLQWQGGFFPDAMNNIRELVLLFLFQFLKCYCFGSTWLIFVCVFFCAWLCSVTWSTVFGLWSLLFAMNNIRECKCLLWSEFIYCNCCNGIR